MKRYNFEIQYNPRCSNYEVETIEHEEGDFVFYEDYKAQLAAAEQRANKLTHDLKEAERHSCNEFIVLQEQLGAAEQRAAQAERDAVRECERIARSYEPVEMSDIPYASTDIRNRYPQHFGDD